MHPHVGFVLLLTLLLSQLLSKANAQLPNHPPLYTMNQSTIIMPCNKSGFTNIDSIRGWSIIDFDWSNAKEIWDKNSPMNDEELLFQQVQMTTQASPNTTVWVYRCSVYAYPWYTSVRTILDDPVYKPWFLQFKPKAPWYSPKCDNNSGKCSDYYHMQEQSPGFPTGDGDCAAPACDCGTMPCGFYMFNHSSTVVVKGQTFLEWFIHSYMFNEVGSSPLVSGFFWDDDWTGTCNFPDSGAGKICEDTGMSQSDVTSITSSYHANMAALTTETLSRGKFSWQMLWTGGSDTAKGSTAPGPLVTPSKCATQLRALCTASSPQNNNRTLMYGFSNRDPSLLNHTLFIADLSNFLLTRGDYAYIGHGWLGCSRNYVFPDELNGDYGTPVDKLCTETSTGVFEREWTKASVKMECDTFKGTITLK